MYGHEKNKSFGLGSLHLIPGVCCILLLDATFNIFSHSSLHVLLVYVPRTVVKYTQRYIERMGVFNIMNGVLRVCGYERRALGVGSVGLGFEVYVYGVRIV